MMDILPQVMTNQFGNYLCQKLIEVCQVKNLRQFVSAVLPSIVDISMDVHGTRAIQTLIEVVGKDPATFHNELLAIGNELESYIFELATHPNGNHVLQAYLLAFKASDLPHQ